MPLTIRNFNRLSEQQIDDLVHDPNLLLDDAKALEAHIMEDMRFNNDDTRELLRCLRLNVRGWIGYRRANGTTKWVRTPRADGDEAGEAGWVDQMGTVEIFVALCLAYILVAWPLYLFSR
jgi:hypothetical protein